MHKTEEREKYDRDLKYGTVAVIICLSYPFLILSFRPTTWFDEVAYWIRVSEVSAFTVSSLFVLNSIHKCYYFEKKSIGISKLNICAFQLVSIIAITFNPYGSNCYATRTLIFLNFSKNVFIISELSGNLYLFWGDSFIKPKYVRNLETSEELEDFDGIIECSTRELECQVCRQVFSDTINERIPMLLTGCGHSFCSECVEKLRERNRSVKCLFCRTSSGHPSPSPSFDRSVLQPPSVTPQSFVSHFVATTMMKTDSPLLFFQSFSLVISSAIFGFFILINFKNSEEWIIIKQISFSIFLILIFCFTLKKLIEKYDLVYNKTKEIEKNRRNSKFGLMIVAMCLLPSSIISLFLTTNSNKFIYWNCLSEMCAFTISALFVWNSIYHKPNKKPQETCKDTLFFKQICFIWTVSMIVYDGKSVVEKLAMGLFQTKNAFILSDVIGELWLLREESVMEEKKKMDSGDFGKVVSSDANSANTTTVPPCSCSCAQLECKICLQKFSDRANERIPRVLVDCGHTLCAECIEKISMGEWQIKCPFCKVQSHKVEQPKNWSIIGMIQDLKEANIDRKLELNTEPK
ncbi:hypothetical protein CAEBREN_20775 [Caenorhabditis brenneri]|uniref:RING-type domain-containing protein n=1 Tax=Caenorhabditis brenneri TaxID=135651 RepID=G0MPF4_CAEBE|nr:hypothetical protein CAEBREN_20775 [Caenorhabditis brenneri]